MPHSLIFAPNENPDHIEAKTEEAFLQNLANFQNDGHFSCKITKIYHLRLKMALVHYIKDLTRCKRQNVWKSRDHLGNNNGHKKVGSSAIFKGGFLVWGSVKMGVTFHGDT